MKNLIMVLGLLFALSQAGFSQNTCNRSFISYNNPQRYLEVAVVTDYEMYVLHNFDSNSVAAYVQTCINLASEVYQRYFNLEVVLVSLDIEDDINDPFPDLTGSDAGSNAIMLTSVLRDHYNGEAGNCIPRDVTFLFSGKPFNQVACGYFNRVGGGVECRESSFLKRQANNTSYGFLNAASKNEPNYITFTHELGHYFDVGHVDKQFPQCDICDNPSTETIMCQGRVGSCGSADLTIQQYFSEIVANRINTRINTQPCLNNEPRIGEIECGRCKIATDITSDRSAIVIGCGNSTQVTFTYELCNDCTSDKTIDLRFSFAPSLLNITQIPPGFPTPTQISASNTAFQSTASVNFIANECKTFTVVGQAGLGSNNTSRPSLDFSATLSNGETYLESAVINVTSSQPNQQRASVVLSDLVNSSAGLNQILEFYNNFPQLTSCGSSPQARHSLSIDNQFIVDIPEEYCFSNGSLIRMGVGSQLIVRNGSTLNIRKGSCVIFEAGARLVVEGGGTLNLEGGSMLSGCTTMWDGVVLQEGARMNMDRAVIRDAMTGIEGTASSSFGSDAYAFVTNSRFINNDVGVYTGDGTVSGVSIAGGNIFATEGGLKPPLSGQRGRKGIDNECDYMMVASVDPDMPENRFINLNRGISSVNSNLFIFGGEFSDLNQGIRTSTSHHATYVNPSRTHPVTFTDCLQGILSIGENNLYVQGTTMSDVSRGMYIINATNTRSIIQNNNITGDKGIDLRNCAPTDPSNRIKNNNITIDWIRGTGIITYENNDGTSWNIEDNPSINVQNGRYGILLRSTSKSRVKNNVVLGDFTQRYQAGIALSGGIGNVVECNTISGLPSSGVYGNNIRLSGSSFNGIMCNSTDLGSNGINAWGVCTKTMIAGNQIGTHRHGVLYGSPSGNANATVGIQKYTGNRWSGNYSGGIGAKYFGSTTNATENRYLVDGNIADNFTNADPTIFVENIPGGPGSEPFEGCPEVGCIDSEAPLEGFVGVSELTHSIVNGNDLTPDFQDATLWTGRRQLYKAVAETPVNEPQFASFMAAMQHQTVGQFYLVDRYIQQALRLSESNKAQLDNIESVIESNTTAIIDINRQLIDTLADSTMLMTQRIVHMDEIRQAVAQQKAIAQPIMQKRVSNLNQIKAQNLTINTVEIYEQNQKTVNDLYLSLLIGNLQSGGLLQYNHGQLETLLGIANQCPLAGGDAVYQARNLLSLNPQFDDADYNDDVLCQVVSIEKSTAYPSSVQQLSLYPNPANESLTVQLKQNDYQGQNRLIIRDVVGKTVMIESVGVDQREVLLSTADLEEGIYFCNWYQGDLPVETVRFIIVHK